MLPHLKKLSRHLLYFWIAKQTSLVLYNAVGMYWVGR